MTVANITPAVLTDGVPYGTNVPLTANEATLGDGLKTPDPIAIAEGHTIVAVVKLTINGHLNQQNSFVFLQTDLGDGTWVDVAWCRFTNTDQSTPAVFVLSGGGVGAMNNSFQARQSGAIPSSANSSNAVPLGGRVRFSGFSNFSSGSSSLAGLTTAVLATITYRLQEPR